MILTGDHRWVSASHPKGGVCKEDDLSPRTGGWFSTRTAKLGMEPLVISWLFIQAVTHTLLYLSSTIHSVISRSSESSNP